jgi:hypothetical protein
MWVVIGALSLVATVIFCVRDTNLTHRTEYGVVRGFEAPECEYIRKLPAGFKLDKEPEMNSPCYHLYTYKLYYSSPAQNAQEYKDKLSAQYWNAFWLLLLLMTLVWAICMGLLYGAGATVAWVIRGFKGTK